MKTARRGSTRRVMTPIEFMARLAALIPPPFYPTITYHGVFAGRSTWRALVTPKARAGGTRHAKKACDDAKADEKAPEREHTKAPEQTEKEAPAPPATSLLSPTPDVVMPTSIPVADVLCTGSTLSTRYASTRRTAHPPGRACAATETETSAPIASARPGAARPRLSDGAARSAR
jgi:hypothetical protein